MTRDNSDVLARACAEAMYADDAAAQALGITIEEMKCGYARMKMTVRAEMLNGHRICHGGFLFLLADAAFAYACNSQNKNTVAQNCDIDFLRPGKQGDVLIAVAEERQRGSRMGLYDVTISRSDGKILAYFRGRSSQIKGTVI